LFFVCFVFLFFHRRHVWGLNMLEILDEFSLKPYQTCGDVCFFFFLILSDPKT